MKDLNKSVFIRLFKEACEKCFGFPLTSPLSEADSKLLSNKIFEKTGLVIGTKSIKNYSLYVLGDNNIKKSENPSNATLDTIARYVLDAPYTDEIQRKDKEGHYPYWFQYRSRFSTSNQTRMHFRLNRKKGVIIFFTISVIVIGLLLIKYFKQRDRIEYFTDSFNSVSEDSLRIKGWVLKAKDTTWWNKRNEKQGHLALYTLKGDNWPLNKNAAGIKNLLIRKIYSDCFTVEAHLTNFIPKENWQQAGILLSEDSTFTGRMIRLSISFNDFFGGYKKPAEIIIQVVSSSENGWRSKPEEIMHLTLFSIEPGNDELIKNNLSNSALKIEKKGNHFRFLYTVSSVESFAFEEAAKKDFNLQPRYVSIFAIQGWADNTNITPAYFDSFTLMSIPCGK